MFNDISDHLPIFAVYDVNPKMKQRIKTYCYKRFRSDEAINAFKEELQVQDWQAIYQTENAEIAYNDFLNIFSHLYDKHCPVKQYYRYESHTSTPWITKGLQRACKKKNLLYKKFLKEKTSVA